MHSSIRRPARWLLLVGALALVATACPRDVATPPVSPTPTDTDAPPPPPAAFTYNTGIFEDTRTDNYWAYLDPDRTVWTGYVLGGTKCALYGLSYPAITVVPSLAEGDVELATAQGAVWVVEVPIRQGLMWSDGNEITAHDMEFTFNTVREFELGANWVTSYTPEVENVEAIDDYTVRITFNTEPGLAIWPHRIGLASWMSQAHWGPIADEARGTESPSATLYSASGEGDPSCGPTVFDSREPGAFARLSANDNYYSSGDRITQYGNGAVTIAYADGRTETYGGDATGEVIAEYSVGPFMDSMLFTLYGAQDSAVLALRGGEVDFLFNPLGLERGLMRQVLDDPNLDVLANPTNGMRYMAFNLRLEPMNDLAFRQAIATMVDRDLMANTVLGGVALPMFTMLPAGNVAWYDEEVAEQLAAPYRDFATEAERVERATEILREAGYTWDTEPELIRDDDGNAIDYVGGSGIRNPDGSPMRNLVLNSLSAGYDPLRATYGIWIEQWARVLGIPLQTTLSGFGPVVDIAFPAEGDPTFDMYILGWSLGNPAFPTFHESFWHSRHIPGNNSPGFSNADYDAAADAFLAAQTFEEAYELLWTVMEPLLAEQLPYLVLFDTPIIEGYRVAAIQFPFTDTLGGIQVLNGVPALVMAAQ